MTISEYKKLQANDTLMIGLDVSEEKTNRVMNRILEVDNFQNVACFCADWAEFVDELAEWGVDGCAKVDFDDPELDISKLDAFIKAENGYIR